MRHLRLDVQRNDDGRDRAQADAPQRQEDRADHLRRHPRPQAGGNGHGQAGLRVGKRLHRIDPCGRGGQEGNAVNESDVRLKLIDPVLKKSWDADNQIFTEYYFTDGEIIVRKGMRD